MTSPAFDHTAEREIQRQLTSWFIAKDPVEIALIQRQRVDLPGGGYTYTDLPARPLQTFKIIQSGAAFTGITESGDGFERQYEFVLLGNWDAQVAVGDHWVDSQGNHWEVGGMIPYNGYEVKAGVYSFGKYPTELG